MTEAPVGEVEVTLEHNEIMSELTVEKRAELRAECKTGLAHERTLDLLALLDALDAAEAKLADWNLIKNEPVVIGRLALIKYVARRKERA